MLKNQILRGIEIFINPKEKEIEFKLDTDKILSAILNSTLKEEEVCYIIYKELAQYFKKLDEADKIQARSEVDIYELNAYISMYNQLLEKTNNEMIIHCYKQCINEMTKAIEKIKKDCTRIVQSKKEEARAESLENIMKAINK